MRGLRNTNFSDEATFAITAAGYASYLVEVNSASQSPRWSEIFDHQWTWQQTRGGSGQWWSPRYPNTVSSSGTYITAIPQQQPPDAGNDPSETVDPTPDQGGRMYCGDAPGLNTMNDPPGGLPAGSIIAFRAGFRTWLTWRNAIGSNVVRWNVDITMRKLEGFGRFQLIRAVVRPGDGFTPLTLEEALELAGWM